MNTYKQNKTDSNVDCIVLQINWSLNNYDNLLNSSAKDFLKNCGRSHLLRTNYTWDQYPGKLYVKGDGSLLLVPDQDGESRRHYVNATVNYSKNSNLAS